MIGSIITSTQAYGIPGRDVADIICTIRDVVNHMKNEGGIVLSLDFKKAFDKVEQFSATDFGEVWFWANICILE